MPFDAHSCPIDLGLYRSKADQVTIELHEDGAVDIAGAGKTTHWTVTFDTRKSTSTIAVFSSGSYSTATAFIDIERKTSALVV